MTASAYLVVPGYSIERNSTDCVLFSGSNWPL
jgi:hypothetical protein